MEMQAWQPLVGEWAIAIRLPGDDGVIGGRTTFEWLEGGGYLIQRSVAEDPRFPRGVMVVWRDDEDFAQRYAGRLSADGRTLDGAWERCDDGGAWVHDFGLTYTKLP